MAGPPEGLPVIDPALGGGLEGPLSGPAPPVTSEGEGPGRPPAGRRWYRGLGWGFWLAVAVALLFILAAILAGLLPLQNADTTQLSCLVRSAPSSAHLLGCDSDGRDILSRVIFGSRVSMVVGFCSIALSLVFGGGLGVIAGYFRGAIDEVVGIVANVFLSFPSLVLALVVVAYLGNSESDVVFIIAIVAWPILFRVVRSTTIEYAERDYVLAERALGATRRRVLFKVILPDVVPSAITYSLIGVALAIVAEGGLSFIGQSVPDPTPTWGNMIAAGTEAMPSYPSLMLSPAVAMFVFILALNLIGDRLRAKLDLRNGTL